MKSLKSLLGVIVILFSQSLVQAQECKVSNVTFKQSGETITIRYDLAGKATKAYQVSVALSDDGGRTFNIRPETLIGDVGERVKPGIGHEIIWSLTVDFPRGLEGDRFIFAVDAVQKKRSKSGWYLLGAGALGGAVYYAVTLSGGEKASSSKGKMVLDISDFN